MSPRPPPGHALHEEHSTLELPCRFPLFLIGPEGTTKTYDVLLPFSTGGFVHGHPVMPVLLKYRARCASVPGLDQL